MHKTKMTIDEAIAHIEQEVADLTKAYRSSNSLFGFDRSDQISELAIAWSTVREAAAIDRKSLGGVDTDGPEPALVFPGSSMSFGVCLAYRAVGVTLWLKPEVAKAVSDAWRWMVANDSAE